MVTRQYGQDGSSFRRRASNLSATSDSSAIFLTPTNIITFNYHGSLLSCTFQGTVVPYKVHDGKRPTAAENSDDIYAHGSGQRTRAGLAEGIAASRPLGNGLWEVRTDLPTKRTARVLICQYREHLVALHGFIKKTRATPDDDLALARKRKKELEG